jgi:putative membrane protein
MNTSPTSELVTKYDRGTTLALWALIGIYAIARVLQVFHDRVPMTLIVTLHIFPPIIFAAIHGALRYRVRGILIFFAISLFVGNIVENVGVATGIPFGSYYFTDLMGPKIFHVPIMLGLAYLGVGYLSWTLARVMLRSTQRPLSGSRVILVPLLAAFVMVVWDFAMDPIWSTVLHAWIWQRGGSYFGVPVSNFLGWYLDVYLIFQFFALYLRGRPANASSLPPSYWRLAITFYGVSALGNLLVMIPQPGLSVVTGPVGVQWKVSVITGACALVSIFIMGGFAALAWTRVGGGKTTERSVFEQARSRLEA